MMEEVAVELSHRRRQEQRDVEEEEEEEVVVEEEEASLHGEKFLQELRNRIDRVSLKLPAVEVRFKDVTVEGKAHVGSRALPSIPNSFINAVESVANFLRILPSRKKKFSILHSVGGIIKPGRLTLLLGPPGSGKTTLLRALSGKVDSELKFSGEVTYNGREMHEFVPQRTAAYVGQFDVHIPQMTVRETLTFSAKCRGVGSAYNTLAELLRREESLKIKPDPYIEEFVKASVSERQKEDIITDYVIKILGLEPCADTIVGDEMTRGISGGQKKRLTTGEMLVAPVNVFFMDSISTGLDSSTTFQIVNSIRQLVRIFDLTALVSLLQPQPETFELFDDIILLSDGKIVYQGPREHVLEFFESMGFRCPERKGIADFLQEVISRKDQEQYWANSHTRYRYVTIDEFAEAYRSSPVGKEIEHELSVPYDQSKNDPSALVRSKYGASQTRLLKACLAREATMMKRSVFLYVLKVIQMGLVAIILGTAYEQTRNKHGSTEDGIVHLGAVYSGIYAILFTGFFEMPMTIDKLPVFYKQRDLRFYPSWAFSLPAAVIQIPVSLLEVALFVSMTYYMMGFNPAILSWLKQLAAYILMGQVSYSFFRFMGAVSRSHALSNTVNCCGLVWLLVFSGFILSRADVSKWIAWAFYTSPLMYVQTAVSVNELLSSSWKVAVNGTKEVLGVTVLESRGIFTDPNWYWFGLAGLAGFIILFNILSALSLSYLDQNGKSQAVLLPQEALDEKCGNRTGTRIKDRKRMLLPFTPLSITFQNITYSMDKPKGMRSEGRRHDRIMLLNGISGAFRPGVLTALMGVSGAGKTTLLDVLSGRKNSGYVGGKITVSGHLKNQETFTRVSGYCEQNDIHSPFVTVYESLLHSAWLRLSPEVDQRTRELFVEEVMDLVELTPLKDALVGFPNLSGLSLEQRKRLTIAVELVANPSIIFMDEPTSGLDARAAAIIMRTVRSTVNTGRTVVCTIHQPSLEIFESFDELLLLTQGGEEVYVGPLGDHSREMIEYFESINGVRRMEVGHNPANWVLEVTTRAQEELLGIKFSEVYKRSELRRRNEALIEELSTPASDSGELHFPTKYAQSFVSQFKACLWKQHKSYWRNTSYSSIRIAFTTVMAVIFGTLFWDTGSKRGSKSEIFNGLGAMNTAIIFMGTTTASAVIPIVISERAVYYRETAARMYSALPYSLAQVVIEIPYTLLQALLYGIIIYAMIGFEWTAVKFLSNLYFIFMTIMFFIYYGMMIIAATPNIETSAVLSGLIYTTWTLFSGFVIPRKRLAVWWRWFPLVSPVSWSFYGLAVSQYGDVYTTLDSGETVADYMRSYFGFRYEFLGGVCVIVLGFALLFVLVYVYSMKALNFQKR